MALNDDVRNLACVPAFSELEPEALRLIVFSAETRILRAGDVLFRRGGVSDGGYVIRSGAITIQTAAGPATIIRPPALVGENALIVETIWDADGVADEPSSVLKISRALFHRVLDEFPDSAVRLHRTNAARLLDLQRDLNGLGRSLVD